VHRKDHGGLQYSSGSVYKIVSTTESVISCEIICCQKLPNISHLSLKIRCKVLDILAKHALFPMFESHLHSSVFVSGESHYIQLVKQIIVKYVNICVKDYGKRFLQKSEFKNDQSSRMFLNKLIIFKGRQVSSLWGSFFNIMTAVHSFSVS